MATKSPIALYSGKLKELQSGDTLPVAAIPSLSAVYQPLDATLTALAGANWAANSLAVGSGPDTVAQVTFAANTFPARSSSGNLVAKTITDFGLSLIDDADAATARTTLGLVIGTNVQAYNANLTTYAGIAPSANVQTLLGAANYAAFRTSLGGSTVGQAIFGLTNPSAVTFLRMNADNTVTARSSADFRTDLGIDTDDAVTFGDLTVNNLVVNGTTMTVNTATITVDDPLIRLADNNGADSVDIGFYGVYNSGGVKYTGLFRDASDGKYRLYTASQTEPTTTVNIGATGHAVATLVANIESSNVAITGGSITGITDLTVADGGTGRSTSTTAYGLIAAGTTATGAHQTLAAGATTEILVGGGGSALPVWTTATGTGAPVRAASPTFSGTVITRGISLSGSGGVPDKINFGANSGAAAIYLFDSFPYRLGFGINSSELQSFVPDGNRWTWNKGGDFQASGTNEVARLEAVGNFKIGGSATRGTTEGTNQLRLFNGTAPAGTLTNGIDFYAAAGEARVMDAAGNSTLLSPHDTDTNAHIYFSKNTQTGKVLIVETERMWRDLDKMLGGGYIHEFEEEPGSTHLPRKAYYKDWSQKRKGY